MFVRVDLAWAAGFFDGEGCFSRAGPTPHATASQTQVECLDIFYNVLGGLGTLSGPHEKSTREITRKPQWIYYAYGRRSHAVFEALRPWLGSYRLKQAARVLALPEVPEAIPFDKHPRVEQLAWAGGFFDGEGCFSWVGDTTTGRITHTDQELVMRFQAVVGFGRIYGPYAPHRTSFGKKPQYVYSTTGFEKVQALLAILWPNLGSAKRTKAMSILEDYRTFWKCGHQRGPTWKMHCPECFHPGPKPGSRRVPDVNLG